jgi:hypothetical protein
MKCFIFHKYSKWSRPYNSKTVRSRGGFGDTSNDDVVRQKRTCLQCGKIEARHLHDGKIEAEEINRRMKEVLEAVSLEPYRDSDLSSLLETLRTQANDVLRLC